MHVLDHSAPYLDGYSSRSKYILEFQKKLGIFPIAVTSPKHTLSSCMEEEINGIIFYRTKLPDSKLGGLKNKVPLLKEKVLMNHLRKNIFRIAQRYSVDIIHAHCPSSCGMPALKAARKLEIPVIYEVRSFWEDAAVNRGKFSEKSVRYKLRKYLETRLMKRVDAVTTICQGLKEEIASRGIAQEKIYVIPNGVDANKFVPQNKDKDLIFKYQLNNKIVIGFIGSFFKSEGLTLLVEAWPQILREYKNVKLLLIGGGEDEGKLKELAHRWGIEKSVIFTGKVPHEDIIRHYSVIDILVYPRLPTRLTNMVTALKPLEAMSMEKAVLASDVGGMRELIKDGISGILFEAGNIDDLVTKCIYLITNETDRKELGHQARIDVIANRNWQNSVSLDIDIYKNLIDNAREYD